MPKKKRSNLQWHTSSQLQNRVAYLAQRCELSYIRPERVFCYESSGANTRAYARIWGLNRIWQDTLAVAPSYILEVIGEKFNRLSSKDQDHVLIHELLHIPKNFSGALVAHKKKGGVNERRVRELYNTYVASHD